jgi:hypothetical protein
MVFKHYPSDSIAILEFQRVDSVFHHCGAYAALNAALNAALFAAQQSHMHLADSG